MAKPRIARCVASECPLSIGCDYHIATGLMIILYLKDSTNLRVTEQWQGKALQRYSYYWLTSIDELKIGWDNAPHHTHLVNFPHHKHVGRKENLQPSFETCLEEVMEVILRGR